MAPWWTSTIVSVDSQLAFCPPMSQVMLAMSIDTRHLQYDDKTLQTAIDEVFQTNANKHLNGLVTNKAIEPYWQDEAPARLAIARAFLARLPQACSGDAAMGRRVWQPPKGVAIDWTRPALHIAAQCGAAPSTVIRYMRRHGLTVGMKGPPKGSTWVQAGRLDPATLDWTLQDVRLAEIHGVCRERIRQLRKSAGLPPSGSPEWLAAGGIVTHPR